MKRYNYIYKITNNINGKIYIGKHSTDKLNDGYMGSGVLIKKAIQKYGIENFTKEYLAFCDNEETLNWLERFYIKKYNAKECGYNLSDGGEGVLGVKGLKRTEETKKKLSDSHKGKLFSVEHKKKLSVAHKGKQRSEEHKRKLSESNKGKRRSEETRIKIGKASLGRHWKMSEEIKRKRIESGLYNKRLSKQQIITIINSFDEMPTVKQIADKHNSESDTIIRKELMRRYIQDYELEDMVKIIKYKKQKQHKLAN